MTSLSFVPDSATLRLLFVKARARLMASCEIATLSDGGLISLTEELNKLADAIRDASNPKNNTRACGYRTNESVTMSHADATALAVSAEQRHAITSCLSMGRDSERSA